MKTISFLPEPFEFWAELKLIVAPKEFHMQEFYHFLFDFWLNSRIQPKLEATINFVPESMFPYLQNDITLDFSHNIYLHMVGGFIIK